MNRSFLSVISTCVPRQHSNPRGCHINAGRTVHSDIDLRFQTVLNRVISGPDRCTRTFTRHILTLTEKINGDELLYTTSESVTTFLSDPAELSMTLLHTEGVCCTLRERNTCLTKRDSLSIVETTFYRLQFSEASRDRHGYSEENQATQTLYSHIATVEVPYISSHTNSNRILTVQITSAARFAHGPDFDSSPPFSPYRF
jgi:hypothetical protein